MITVGWIKAGDTARVDYYLSRAALEEYPREAADRGQAMERYYGGHTANGPGRWFGRGAEALGLDGLDAEPEQFRRAVLEGFVDGAARARPEWRAHPDALVAAEPFAAAVRQLAAELGGEPVLLFGSQATRREWARLSGKADRFGTVPAALVDKLARHVGGIDPAGLYGPAEWARAVAAGDRRVDTRTAALDVVMSADKSVSVLYGTADGPTRSLIVSEFHAANRSALGYLDALAGVARRGSSSQGVSVEVGTDGLLAVGFVHDEARPTGDCACGDPHLHEHVIVLNTARGADGKWSAAQLDRVAPAAKTAGFLQEAELRARLSDRLGVAWRPVVNGLASVQGIADAQLRQFSKRHSEIDAELAEIGAAGLTAGNAAGRDTKQAKREQLPIGERVARWQAEAATVGLTADTLGEVLDRPAPTPLVAGRDGVPDVLGRLTADVSSFTRADLLRALAQDARSGARVGELLEQADRILASPAVVALGEGEGGLTRSDVRRAAGGRVFAYQVEQKWTTPEQLALEQRLVDAALGRAGEGCGRLDEGLVDAVIGRQPFVLSEEQAAAVRGLTMSGAGVDVLHAGAGSGKTSAVLGTVRQAYETAGYRVIGATTSAKAARVLEQDGGLQSQTIAGLLLDLDRAQAGGLAARTVLVLDEASMIGSRDLARVLEHAERATVKVLVVGDTRQLASVDAGGGLRALVDRLGAQQLHANRRQHAGWERDALADLAAGRPGQALRAYTAHDRVTVADSGLGARRAMVAGWWADVEQHGIDKTMLVATRNADRVELNALARAVMRQAGRLGEDQVQAAGRAFAAGDRVVLLRNSSARRYDNGDTGTVAAIDAQRRLVVELDRGSTVTLPVSYTADGHVDLAYAGTVHKAQGATVQTAHVLGTALARESGYVALSRGRTSNRLYLVEGDGHVDPELDLPAPAAREAYEQAARTLGASQAKTLALDSAVFGEPAGRLQEQLTQAGRLLRSRPASDVARLGGFTAELDRLRTQVDQATARLNSDRQRLARLPRRSRERPALAGRVERQQDALQALQGRLGTVAGTVAAAEHGTTPRHDWETLHRGPLGRAVAAGRELAWRSRAQRQAAAAVDPPAVEVPVIVVAPVLSSELVRTRSR